MRPMLVALLVALAATLSIAAGAATVPTSALALGAVTAAADKEGDEASKDSSSDSSSELTLKKIFPEKGLFGPRAGGAAFSHDGRYGAFLWRPYPERRHGSDLWIHDFDTGETERITSATVMSRFQAETRKVRDDRVKKAKKRGAGKDKGKGRNGTERRRGAGAGGDDPITGTWEGTVTASDEDTMPPGGMAVVMELRLASDGSVSGVVKAATITAAISEGRFDRESGLLSFVVRGEDGGVFAVIELTLEDGGLVGTARMEDDGAELDFEAIRTVIGESEEDDEESARSDRRDAGAAGQAGDEDDGDKEDDEKDVGDDREDTRGNDEDEKDEDGEDEEDRSIKLGDQVDDKDADDEKAPRYAGVQSFVWSPTADEMIFTSMGDLFMLRMEDLEIVRLTRTGENERGVAFLPDGSGYSYLRGGDLIRVRFGEHLIEQLNPRLTGGERMSSYRLSPDGTRLVFIATKGEGRGGGRKVNIVNYRDRFAQVRQVDRLMSDDPLPKMEYSIYLHELDGLDEEQGQLKKVYTRARSGPRDILRVPEWSPDSSRVAFAVFEQSSGIVEIMEASFEESEDEDEEDGKDKSGDGDGDEGGDEDGDGDGDGDDDETTEESGDDGADDNDEQRDGPTFEIREARPVYRFLHNGGPNTPQYIRPAYLPDSRRMVFITELSGFRQLHVLDPTYEHLEQLTRGRYEIYPFRMSEDHTRMFALATRDDPTQQHVFRIDLESGDVEKLSDRTGFYDAAAVSNDGTRVLANHVDFGALREMYAIDTVEETVTALTDSHPEKALEMTASIPEYFTYENRHGQTIHGHLFKPDDWTPEDRRPLLIYVYGGPLGRRNMVSRGAFSAPSYFFANYMAKKHGYVTCTIDPRGASGYGGLFEKSNYEQVGKPQVEDLVDGVDWFVENAGVDPDRIGLHGWSFGGFQTQMCMYTEPEVFQVGIAGAGPTEWENYNAWYSTGTIGKSREGKTDLSKFSLLPLAKNLKGRLLLVHGVEDSNVLYQDTMRVYRELLKAGKEAHVDLFIDPTGGHGMGGDVKTINRYRKYEDYLLTYLGDGGGDGGGDDGGDDASEHGDEHDQAEAEDDAGERSEEEDAERGERRRRSIENVTESSRRGARRRRRGGSGD